MLLLLLPLTAAVTEVPTMLLLLLLGLVAS